MSTETHVNALIQEMDEAYAAALGAISKFKEKADAVKSHLMEVGGQIVHAAETGVEAAEEDLKKQKAGAKKS